MRTLLPPSLRRGARIGIAAPAGPVRPESFDKGLVYLERRGFELVRGSHLTARRGYLAGSDAERLDDLNRLLADPSLDALWFARGGYGSARIIEQVDLNPLRSRPKALIGYSDLTVLHAAVHRQLRLATFYGPHVSELGDPDLFDEASLWTALSGDPGELIYPFPRASVLRQGAAEGVLLGGCLSLLSSLVGTPFEVRTDGAILFLEDVGEEPYRIDRMLAHLRLAGRLRGIHGLVVGVMVGCSAKEPANDLPLAEILAAHLGDLEIPVVVDLQAGHVKGKMTLPLGRRVRLDTAAGHLAVHRR